MPLDPRLSRSARAAQHFRIVTRRRVKGAGGGSSRLYADAARMIAVDQSADPVAYAQFTSRIESVASRMKIATGVETYASFVSEYDAMTVDEKKLPLMTNIEFPWLSILGAADSATPSADWYGAGRYAVPVQTEFTRQGAGTVSGSTTMAEYKAVAEQLWLDCHAYATSQGTPRVVEYGSSGLPSSGLPAFTYGIPLASIWPSPGPNTTLEYYAENLPSFPAIATTSSATPDGGIASLMRAQKNAYAWGQSGYTFYPTNGLAVSNIADWNDGSLVRKIGTVSQSEPPDYLSLSSYQSWMTRQLRCLMAHSKAARDLAVAGDPTLATGFPPRSVMFVFLGGLPETAVDYITKNHWGVYDTDPAQRSRILYGGLFSEQGDLDSAPYYAPDEVWAWDLASFYEATQLTTAVYSAGSPYTYRMHVLLQRYCFERMCCGVEMTPPGSPIGEYTGTAFDTPTSPAVPDGTNGGAHWNWFWNSVMDEATYYRDGSGNPFPSATVWWNGGTSLPGGRTLANGVLAPYLDFTNRVTGADVFKAWRRYATEYRVRQLEELSAIIGG